MAITVSQALDDFGRTELGDAYNLFKGWLEEMLGEEAQLDACHFWVTNRTLNMLAVTGQRVWKISMHGKGYESKSLLVGDISVLELRRSRADGRVTLRVGFDEEGEELTGENKQAESLISLHRQLSR